MVCRKVSSKVLPLTQWATALFQNCLPTSGIGIGKVSVDIFYLECWMQQHKAQAVWDPLEWCMQRKLRETDTVDKFAWLVCILSSQIRLEAFCLMKRCLTELGFYLSYERVALNPDLSLMKLFCTCTTVSELSTGPWPV